MHGSLVVKQDREGREQEEPPSGCLSSQQALGSLSQAWLPNTLTGGILQRAWLSPAVVAPGCEIIPDHSWY